jgi:pyrrolysine biosynthesis protein PylC
LGFSEVGSRGPIRPRRLAIAGGGLQGLEATYLARKAGFETLLLDRRPNVLAAGICHRFTVLDLADSRVLPEALGPADMVLPTTENPRALKALVEWCGENRFPLAFDPGAYAVSCSKGKSNALFQELGLPAPAPWPDCDFPVLAKPDSGSGSHGIQVFPDRSAFEARFGSSPPPDLVIQEYLPGPSYSIEVMGRPGAYTPVQVTNLEMDTGYDCKRVSAPSTLPAYLTRVFEKMAVDLAEAVGLSGIMDVEAVLHEGRLKVLEMDARFPSQTPMTVYHSTGFNMVERLVGIFSAPEGKGQEGVVAPPARGTVLEHIRYKEGLLLVGGEGMMNRAGPLNLEGDFFGADEALTTYAPGKDEWVATFMVSGEDLSEARRNREGVVGRIRDRLGVTHYLDEGPDSSFGLIK